MNKKVLLKTVPALIVFAVLLASCGTGTTSRLTVAEENAIKDYVMSSYFMLRGDDAITESSKAAWPAHTDEIDFPAAGQSITKKKSNYPERGQKTVVTITTTGTTNIYFVENVTSYPKRKSSIVKTTESYYVKDSNTDGRYTDADQIWDTQKDEANFNKRETFETEYNNGYIRKETVEKTTTQDNIKFAAFDINGDLSFPAPNSNGIYIPPTDANANYSSMVSYIQEEGNTYSFWSDYKLIVGTRYYTEHGSGSNVEKTSVSYEKVIERKSSFLNFFNFLGALLKKLFNDDYDELSGAGVKLSETVIRYKIDTNGRKTIKTDTKVFDKADQSTVVKFKADYEEAADGSVSKSGEPVSY